MKEGCCYESGYNWYFKLYPNNIPPVNFDSYQNLTRRDKDSKIIQIRTILFVVGILFILSTGCIFFLACRPHHNQVELLLH